MMVWPLASEEPDIPVLMYHELDGDRMERRKVLVFRDGSLAASSDTVDVGGYELGSEATPPMEEIRADPQFHPHLISRNDFEWAWAKATGALSPASDPCRSADERCPRLTPVRVAHGRAVHFHQKPISQTRRRARR